MLAAKNQSHTLLFTLDSPLPPELAASAGPFVLEPRRQAQAKFANFIKKTGQTTPLLVARFIARQVAIETQKLTTASLMGVKQNHASVAEKDFTDAEGTADGYSLSDHIERLRYLEVERDEEEAKLLADVLRYAVPGLEGFITGDKHAIISGKMAYNAFGVCYAGGRDDKVCSQLPHLKTK
jgi:import receptor subunit TOM20